MTYVQALQLVESFKDLKQNWDSYGGRPIDRDVIDMAKVVLGRLGEGFQPVPTSTGGVDLEYDGHDGFDILVSIERHTSSEAGDAKK